MSAGHSRASVAVLASFLVVESTRESWNERRGRRTVNNTRSNGERDDSRLFRSKRTCERVHGSFRARISSPARDAFRRRSRRNENDPPGELRVLIRLDEIEGRESVGDYGNEGEEVDVEELLVLLESRSSAY